MKSKIALYLSFAAIFIFVGSFLSVNAQQDSKGVSITEIYKVGFDPITTIGVVTAKINGEVLLTKDINGGPEIVTISGVYPYGSIIEWTNSIDTQTIKTVFDGTGAYDGRGDYVNFSFVPDTANDTQSSVNTNTNVSKRSWGVSVSDPIIDTMRDKLIQQVGVGSVVAARINSAVNRLKILDTRITSLIDNTVDTCPLKAVATNQLVDARATLSTVDASTMVKYEKTIQADGTVLITATIVPAPTSTTDPALINKSYITSSTINPDGTVMSSTIDPALVTNTQATLDSSLLGMKSAVNTVSGCPEYSTVTIQADGTAVRSPATTTMTDTTTKPLQ